MDLCLLILKLQPKKISFHSFGHNGSINGHWTGLLRFESKCWPCLLFLIQFSVIFYLKPTFMTAISHRISIWWKKADSISWFCWKWFLPQQLSSMPKKWAVLLFHFPRRWNIYRKLPIESIKWSPFKSSVKQMISKIPPHSLMRANEVIRIPEHLFSFHLIPINLSVRLKMSTRNCKYLKPKISSENV